MTHTNESGDAVPPSIFLHNTLTGEKELFKPLQAGKVSIYNCGPTVYNYAHIGNFRTYVFGDVLRRVFEYAGYSVHQVMNITDVDDKTIRGSRQSGMSLSEFTRKYEEIFKSELDELNIKKPTGMPRATESVPDMILLIEDLLKKEIAYKTADGIYFSIKKSPGYGTLARLDMSSCQDCPEDADNAGEKGHRIKVDEYDKENAQDFALWKFHAEEDGDVSWDTPFGKGRPGWHIECSAMAMKALGPTIDIHTGASDLIFPHHTNEIAQSEGVTGKTFVNAWLHAGFLNVDSKKMAKSAGNFFTLPVLKEKNIQPLAYRYWLLTAHYRTQINFTEESLSGAETALSRLRESLRELWIKAGSFGGTIDLACKSEFEKSLYDDLNVSKALALAWNLLKDKSVSDESKLATIIDFDRVFGLRLKEWIEENAAAKAALADGDLPSDIRQLVEERKSARERKDWKRSDDLRDQLKALGYEVVDNSDDQRIFKV